MPNCRSSAIPGISIIIPNYNGEKVVNHCLRSIIKQSFKDFEVIVVDDGSLDNSLQILREIQRSDARIIVLSKKNAGRMLARLDGYKVARGKYVMFVDNDDFLPPNSLRVLFDTAESTRADCIVGDYNRVLDNRALIRRKGNQSMPCNRVIPREEIWKTCFGPRLGVDDNLVGTMWAKLFRKSTIDKAFSNNPGQLFPDCLLEDWWFTLIFLQYVNTIYVTDTVVYYYRDGGSTSKDFPGLENSNMYFDFRYKFFNKKDVSLVIRTYVGFVYTFYWLIGGKIRCKKYSRDDLLKYVATMINSMELIEWAREHKEFIPSEIKDMSYPIVTNNPEAVFEVAQKKHGMGKTRLWVKRLLMKVLS